MGLFVRQSLTIAGKDLRAEMRTKEALNASFAFSLVILVLFSFAFDPSSEELRTISGGLLWLVLPLASVMFPKLVHASAKAGGFCKRVETFAGEF